MNDKIGDEMKRERDIPQFTLGMTEDGEQFGVRLTYGYDSGGPSDKNLTRVKKLLRKPEALGEKGNNIHVVRSNIDDIIIFGKDRESIITARDLFVKEIPGLNANMKLETNELAVLHAHN